MLLKNVAVSRKSVVRNAMAPVIEGLENRCLMSATLTVTNLDGLPFNDRMIFNKIQHLDQNFPNVTHDHAQLKLTNSGDAALTFGTVALNGPWTITPDLSNTTLAVGASQTVTLTFTQSTLPAHAQNQTNFTDNTNGGASIFGSLAIPSNDPAHANTTIALAGYWQNQSEHNAEPNLTVITNFLSGYTTKISDTYKVDLTQPVNSSTQEGDEVVSDMWLAANPNQAVSVRQLAGFHRRQRRPHLLVHRRHERAELAPAVRVGGQSGTVAAADDRYRRTVGRDVPLVQHAVRLPRRQRIQQRRDQCRQGQYVRRRASHALLPAARPPRRRRAQHVDRRDGLRGAPDPEF